MTMRLAELDFQSRPGAAPAGWLLLALGVVALTAAGLAWQQADAERERLRGELASVTAQRPAARAAPARPVELAAARRVVETLNRPWAALFAELEAAEGADVALLELRPDIVAGELRLAAEARDLGAMLAYHRWLEGRPQLRDVALVRHEQLGRDGAGPVRFELQAQWRADALP